MRYRAGHLRAIPGEYVMRQSAMIAPGVSIVIQLTWRAGAVGRVDARESRYLPKLDYHRIVPCRFTLLVIRHGADLDTCRVSH